MPSRHTPAESLADIIENADRIERYLDGVDREAFAANGLIRDAVERCMERVCEAAHRLGEQAAQLMPNQSLSRAPPPANPARNTRRLQSWKSQRLRRLV